MEQLYFQILLNVVMLNVVMLSVVMLSVMTPNDIPNKKCDTQLDAVCHK